MKNLKYVILLAIIAIAKIENINSAAINSSYIAKLEQEFLRAASSGNVKTIEECLSKNVNVNIYDSQGYTALIYAAAIGDVEMVKLLLNYPNKHEINVNAYDAHG